MCKYLFLSFGLLSACSSICPEYPIDMPSYALDAAAQDMRQGEYIPNEWWTLFNDSQLTEWIETALSQNPTIQIAENRIQSAATIANRVKSTLYPYIWLGADVSRQKLSRTGVIPFRSAPNTPVVSAPTDTSVIPEYFTLYETELNFRYEFDFWHKNKNTFRAALSQIQAKCAELAFIRLNLGVEVARTYYDLQVDLERKKIAEVFVQNRFNFLELVKERVAGHVDTDLTAQVAASSLTDSRDLVLQIEGDIAVNQYRLLAYLAGNFTEEILPISQASIPQIALPENLPLHLLSNRPDITSQLWMIESAGRQVEVAKAGFYPDFNLTAFFGFQTIHFAELFKWPASTFFNVDPAMTLPLFDAGKRLADLEGSEINYNLAILQYNQLIIDSAEEVLTAIAVLKNQSTRLIEFERKLNEQQELYRLTSLKVENSLSSGLDALASEANVLIAKDQVIRAKGRVIQSLLTLIKSLGGGYDCAS